MPVAASSTCSLLCNYFDLVLQLCIHFSHLLHEFCLPQLPSLQIKDILPLDHFSSFSASTTSFLRCGDCGASTVLRYEYDQLLNNCKVMLSWLLLHNALMISENWHWWFQDLSSQVSVPVLSSASCRQGFYSFPPRYITWSLSILKFLCQSCAHCLVLWRPQST